MAFALADGLAYGLDPATGAPVWQVSVGLASPFAPQAVPGEPSRARRRCSPRRALAARGRTGAVLWRLELGEAVEEPPLVLGDQLYQVLPSGKLVVIGLEDG